MRPRPNDVSNAYSSRRTIALLLAVTGPSAVLIWGGVPLLVAHTDLPPIVIYLLGLLASGTWTSLVGLWALRREGIVLRWDTLGSALFLARPASRAGLPARLRRLAVLTALVAFAYAPLVLWHAPAAMPRFIPQLGALRFLVFFSARLQPGYARPMALADPALAHAYWFVPLALLAWALYALVAEELFFRGLLLSRIRDRADRGRIGVNALLYFAYCLALRPFSAPPRLLYGFVAAWLASRSRSTRPALSLRALEGLVVAALAILAVSTRPLPPIKTAPSLPHIARQPKPVVWWDWMRRAPWSSLPKYQPDSSDPWQLDLRGKELAHIDLTGRSSDLLMSTFDSTTVWPERLPEGFSPRDVMELGKNPGVGVRRLHARGITGRGVGIGIVDRPLLTRHVEYTGRLRGYEEVNTGADEPAQMHGPAVASIAVGRSLGVAPDAGLYFVALGDNPRSFLSQYQGTARGTRRLVELNRRLSSAERIRVISISQGWILGQTGYEEATQAIRQARREGIFVIYCSMERDSPLAFHGLGREALADPDDVRSFGPGLWWKEQFFRQEARTTRLLAPMDARTTASPTGVDHYVFYRQGGWSWVAPYIAGLYALALQVDPHLTGERFWEQALATGRTRSIESGNTRRALESIVDPEALIESLQRRADRRTSN